MKKGWDGDHVLIIIMSMEGKGIQRGRVRRSVVVHDQFITSSTSTRTVHILYIAHLTNGTTVMIIMLITLIMLIMTIMLMIGLVAHG